MTTAAYLVCGAVPTGDAAPAELPWIILLHDIAKPATASVGEDGRIHNYGHDKLGAKMADAILRRLKFPRKQIDDIVFTVRQHMNLAAAPKMRKAKLRRLLMRPTFELELEQHLPLQAGASPPSPLGSNNQGGNKR